MDIIYKSVIPFVTIDSNKLGRKVIGFFAKNCYYFPLRYKNNVYLYRYNICNHRGCDTINAIMLVKCKKSRSMRNWYQDWLHTDCFDAYHQKTNFIATVLPYYDVKYVNGHNELKMMFILNDEIRKAFSGIDLFTLPMDDNKVDYINVRKIHIAQKAKEYTYILRDEDYEDM